MHTCFGGGKARFGWEGVERDDARVKQEGQLESGGRFEKAHDVGAAVGGFGARCEGKSVLVIMHLMHWNDGGK